MAKIITENFRVSNTKEFIESFSERNEVASNSITDEIESYLIRQGILYNEQEDPEDPLEQALELTETQRSAIVDATRATLDEVKPENEYYVFASTYEKEEGDTIANTQFEKREFLRRVIFGKKIDDVDIRHMFTKNPWVANRVYTAFDDIIDAENLNTYVTVGNTDGESSIKVFKCLSNHNNSPSTVEPAVSLLNTDYETQTLADGYVWKYMFEVPTSEYLTYQTTNELPYVEDAVAISKAKESISQIKIEKTPAFLFTDLNLGECLVLSVTDLNSENDNIETKTYRTEILVKDRNKSVKTARDAYKDMYLRVINPDNSRTTIFDITASEEVPGTTDRIFVYIQSQLQEGSHPNLDRIEGKDVVLSPKVEVTKSPGVPAIAYGVLNSAGTLTSVNFINPGTQYKYATAKVVMPSSISERASETVLRVVPSPLGGHGADPITELFMSRAVVVTNFFATRTEKIPETNGYTKIGLVKNPEFSSPQKIFPRVFDNRLYFEVASNSNLINIALPGRVVEQVRDGEKLYATIHETTFDEETGITTIYTVDYTGDWSDKIKAGTLNIKSNRDDDVVLTTISINNVKINQVPKTFVDGVPSGEFENNEYVPYSGEVLHFIDFDKIERSPNRKEKVKLVFDF